MKVNKRNLFWLIVLLILVLVSAFLINRVHSNRASALGNVNSPTQVIYEFTKESGGTTPSRGSKILLGFDPRGEAYIYALKPGEWVAYHGHWSYEEGKMSLQISSPSLSVDAHFPIRLEDENVTMPFQIFAGAPGTSQWKASALPIANGIFAVYYAAIADSVLALAQHGAVQRAYDYAQARIEFDKSSATSALSSAKQTLQARLVPLAAASSADPNADKPDCTDTGEPISITRTGPDDFLLTYLCGLTVAVSLQPPFYHSDEPAPLLVAPLGGDPRVHLNTNSPGTGFSDPPEKTALIINPFVDHDENGQPNDLDTVAILSDYFKGSPTAAPDPSKFSIVPALIQDGYNPITLINSEATVEHIAKALISNPNPGILLFETHGDGNGFLRTHDYWAHGPRTTWKDFLILQEELRHEGLGDLVDYGRDPGVTDNNNWHPVTLQVVDLAVNQDPTNLVNVAALKPKFWEWAEKRHQANFHRSLVFINGCATDQTDYLRTIIQAGAYFGWKESLNGYLAAAVNKYLVASLSRPTHSAEESFYNLMRVARTHQMIYVEDKLLDTAVGQGMYDLNNLSAYGWNGTTMLDYRGAGWYGTEKEKGPDNFSGGQVWWLLFVERWSPNPNDGKKKIAECWEQSWSVGNLGGMASPQCQNYNNGSLPKVDEVVYATYLLDGTTASGFNGTLVPRWTLNDGKAAQNSSQ